MGNKYKDLTGKIFNDIKVVSFDEDKAKEKSRGIWLCECLRCGEQFYQDTYSIQKGRRPRSHKCSNYHSPQMIDETGNRYGRLEVIKRVKSNKRRKACWECKCECGNVVIVVGEYLRSGNTTSCGCKHREPKLIGPKKRIDETGHKYGLLTVLEEDKVNKKDSGVWWKCQCKCGEIVSCRGSALRAGYNLSCGKCAGHSTGEAAIRRYLKNNNIVFKEQYTFNGFRFPETNGVPKYDFAIFFKDELSFLIEYQGIQHYKQVEYFKEKLEDIQNRDIIKKQYCQENNIPLEIIPYTSFDNIEEVLSQIINKHSV